MILKLVSLILVGANLVQCQVLNQAYSSISSVVDTLVCSIAQSPWQCARQNGGRFLDIWSGFVEDKYNEFKEEADAEFAKSVSGRSLTEVEISKRSPSAILETIGNYVSNGVDNIMSRGKDKKKKKKKPQPTQVHVIEYLSHDDDGGHHGIKMHKIKHRHKIPKKTGRSNNGASRGKKKKKKKAIMKLLLVGAVLKAKIELLLKVLSTHLQIKFLAIAFAGLLINVARFWIELKKGHSPQKVIYYEHAQHQHHYDEHDEGWGGSSGGYWKRSLDTEKPDSDGIRTETTNPYTSADIHRTDSTDYRSGVDEGYPGLYRQSEYDPHSVVYNRQIPTNA